MFVKLSKNLYVTLVWVSQIWSGVCQPRPHGYWLFWGVVLICLGLPMPTLANGPELTQCERTLGQVPASTTIDNCRESLTTPISRPRRLAVLEALGRAYAAQGDMAAAVTTWQEGLQYLQPSRKDPAQGLIWANLVVLTAQAMGQQDAEKKAELLLLKSSARADAEFGRHAMPSAMLQDALGTWWSNRDQLDKAQGCFQRARIAYEVLLGRMHPKTLETRLNYATGLLSLGQDDEGMATLEVLAGLVEGEAALQNEPVKADVLTFLGTLRMQKANQGGERAKEELQAALAHYNKALNVRIAAFGQEDVRTSQSMNNLGVALYRAGHLQAAEDWLAKAYGVRKLRLGPQDPLTQSTEKNLRAVVNARAEQLKPRTGR
jgi:tetratricopeptide (TPR) repeat protein